MNKIIQFQKDNGLVADGIIGIKTLTKMKEVWKRNSLEEVVGLLGQVEIESANFERSLENTNYSAKRLIEIFKKRFDRNHDGYLDDSEKAKIAEIAGNSVKVANFVYANRGGNRDEASGDGNRYKGSTAIQITLKDNYKKFSKWLGLDKILTAEEAAEKYFWEGALFYFDTNNLWQYTKTINTTNITKLSKAINLGNPNSKYTPNHLKGRIEATLKYNKLIK